MISRRSLARALLVLVLVAAAAAIAVTRAAGLEGDWQSKVDPSVLLAATAGDTQFIAYMHAQADLGPAASLATKEEKGRFVYEALALTARESQSDLLAQLATAGAEHRSFWVANAVLVTGGLAVLELVAAHPDVAAVYPVGTGQLNPPPGGTEAVGSIDAVGPSINHVRANQAWELGIRGQGAVVAGADTGVRWTHNALRLQYRGWDAASSTADHGYNWHDAIKNPNAQCPGSSPQPCDDDQFFGGGHGTHTMGTIVGDDGGANQIGMAPDAQWVACRNMNNGLGAVPTYMDCMQWFIAPTDANGANPDPSKAPDVVNNSWGCVEGCAAPLLKDLIDASRAAGIFHAVSAGNDGSSCSTIAFPLAVYDAAFSVGATNATNDTIASFSSRGPVLTNLLEGILLKPDIVAPGVGIRSALRANDNAYGSLSGTSMAGPHVAGLVALLVSANPQLRGDVDTLEAIIRNTAVPLTTTQGCGGDTSTQVPNNTFGWGRIDALAAVNAARPPVAVNDAATTEEETPVTIDVLANDSQPAGNELTVTSASRPSNGTAAVNADGSVTYTPDAGFTGVDAFAYTVEDTYGSTASAAVLVTVEAGAIPGACAEIGDGDARIVYAGAWETRTSTDASDGTYARLARRPPAAAATVSFTGDRLAYAYGVSSKGGTAEVVIDGISRGTISYASGAKGAEAPEFGRFARYEALGLGAHTFELRYGSGAIYVDGFGFACPS
jgi:serine protease AprX